MDSSAPREGDQKIPSAWPPGEYGAPVDATALGAPEGHSSHRASADSFRKLAAKLRRASPPLEVEVVAAAVATSAPQPPAILQPEIESRPNSRPDSQPEPVAHDRFDMGWTSRVVPLARRPGRREAEAFSDTLDEFSDLPPEFSDDRPQPESLPTDQPDAITATTAPAAAATPALDRPDTYKFWEQQGSTGASLPAAAASAPSSSQSCPEGRIGSAAEEATSAAPGTAPPLQTGEPSALANDQRTSSGAQPSDGGAPAAEVAWSLLEIISLSNDTTQPQERALAADALLRLLPKLTARILMAIADRMSLMEAPPRLIVNQLVRDHRPEVAGPLLEKCSRISDQDLVEVATGSHVQSIRMIARRRTLSAALCNAVIASGEPSVILTLVRNPGAAISFEGFIRLNAIARQHVSLQAPLATRSDLPAPVAFELFWSLPVELRRYVLSRFLTDSKTLEKILKFTKAVDSDVRSEDSTAGGFPARERVDQFVALAVAGEPGNAAKLLAELAGVNVENAARIIADSNGEPLAAALKALGVPRARFEEIIQEFRLSSACALREDRKVEELQGVFETLSFNKARVLLTYWDWAAARSGPYELAAGRP